METIDDMLTDLTKLCLVVFDRFCPQQTLLRKKHKDWITNDIIQMCKKRDRLHAKMIKKPSLESINCFRMFGNKVKMAIRRAQRDYHDKKIVKYTLTKQMFQAFNLFCGKLKPAQKEIEPKSLNDFFVNIGKQLSNSLSPAGSASQNLDGNISSFVIFKTDEHEVFKVIGALKTKTSSGHDDLSTKMIKFCSPVISVFLANSFNICIDSAYFPDACKIAKIFAFLKEGDRENPSIYRPNSLMTVFSKIFEKLIY